MATRPAYAFQLARAARFYNRLTELVPDDLDHRDELNAYEDALHACSVMCWQVKDWVQNDHSLPVYVRQKVVADVHASPALTLCRDVANGVKHLEVRDNRTGVLGTAALHRGQQDVPCRNLIAPAAGRGDRSRGARRLGQVYYRRGAAGQLAPANRIYFRTEEEAQRAGYRRSTSRGC